MLLVGLSIGYFVYATQIRSDSRFAFKYGLDISGGVHLVYSADTSSLPPSDVPDAMSALRAVIERRVNLFGVSEPIVQVQNSGFVSGEDEKLIVDLPGVTDVEKATEMIGQTPLLEFKVEVSADTPKKAIVDKDGKFVLVPVPLSLRRLCKRDFNQAELICQGIAQRIPGCEMRKDILQRVRHTKEQARLARNERFANTKDAFDVRVRPPSKVVLVDDVATTGATLQACAQVLKRAGALEVHALVVAHG